MSRLSSSVSKWEEFHLESNIKCFGPFPLPHTPIYVILKESVGQKRNRKEKHSKVQITPHSFPIKPFSLVASPYPRASRCMESCFVSRKYAVSGGSDTSCNAVDEETYSGRFNYVDRDDIVVINLQSWHKHCSSPPTHFPLHAPETFDHEFKNFLCWCSGATVLLHWME